jgi:hypothetical protein
MQEAKILPSENNDNRRDQGPPSSTNSTAQEHTEALAAAIRRLTESRRPPGGYKIVEETRRLLGFRSIDAIYRNGILTERTRQYEIATTPPNAARIEIIHTLLGIELKIGNRRLLCPDLATARYLSVLARLGCQVVAVPYDITRVSRLADELESSWHRTVLIIDALTRNRSQRMRSLVLRRMVDFFRAEIASAGAGPAYPEFARPARHKSKPLPK